MSYQVLARKWRPHTFKEMVGQEHVLRALINALDNDRLHHAFLFTGTRGVGKTTVARILAKSLNCETGISSTPCGECSSCREIDEGRFIDLIEVDAASRTKVEDTRELMENVQYAPTRGRYKVYLIDEVHMLSTHSFNALLKTLEEPPPHVKFLLATTDPQRLPVTILSRCLQFNLKRIPLEQIIHHMEDILRKESIEFEAPAVAQIATSADGSMRDALSLLDQAIAYGGGTLKENEVHAMLGTIDKNHVYTLLNALASGDGQSLMTCVQTLAEQAPDFSGVLAEIITVLHTIALTQTVPNAVSGTQPELASIATLADQISAEDTQLYYQIALHGRRDLPLAPDARTGFEMIMLRMLAFKPAIVATAPASKKNADPVKLKISATSSSPDTKSVVAAPAMATPAAPIPAEKSSWADIAPSLKLGGLVQQLALNCSLNRHDENIIELALEEEHAHLLNQDRKNRLQQALQTYFGTQARLDIKLGKVEKETPAIKQKRESKEQQQAAIESITQDKNVQALVDKFNGEVNESTIRPSK
jgi:DNA polymerase-3 subunit gamma/tau